ncbi:protocadherin Fat 4-like [Haliotis cracherodii]|uniref:protocadherin Fat 4-like n=1 Tax=Haliotis cracherodii TaxID=6455 RepID=UPI0039EB4046
MSTPALLGALVFILLPHQYAASDCIQVNSEISSFYREVEHHAENKVYLNMTLPSDRQVTVTTTPPNHIILENFPEAGNTRWILRVNGSLDAETVSQITGQLTCTGPLTPRGIRIDFTVLVADVNEYPPKFGQNIYTVYVSELTLPNTTVFTLSGLATDPDITPTRIYYSLSHNQNPPLFGLNTFGTELVTLQRLDFDFSGSKQYNVTITAKENTLNGLNSTALIMINVLDGDDLNPRFEHPLYNATINEGTYRDFVLDVTIRAKDEDTGVSATIDYNITDASPGNPFSILNNGSLMANGVLQPETTYTINIKAFQTDRPEERYDDAVVLVTVIDVNDHAPVMSASSYTASLTENSLPGTVVIGVNATDDDYGFNAAFVYHFTNTSVPFEVDTEGDIGMVRVRTGANIDREKQAQYVLEIYAEEVFTVERLRSGNSTLIITVEDVNDNSPTFDSPTYSFSIDKNDTIGKIVGWVNATDADAGANGIVKYSIQHITSPIFKLDPDTGEITVNVTLGDENVGQVYLAITAEDQGPPSHRRTSVVSVAVVINDVDLYAPVFDSPTYNRTVPEDTPINSLLMQIVASDGDSGDSVTYTVISGVGDNTFSLDSNSGVLTLVKILDRESHDLYTLTVQASDGHKSSNATVVITVGDVNDNSPKFGNTSYTFPVSEDIGAGQHIGRVGATDADIGANHDLTYSLLLEGTQVASFQINSSSGEITTFRDLDYENETNHVLLVSAADHGDPARSTTVTVTVVVNDVNDNSPIFVSTADSITVNEGVQADFLYTAVAHDSDSGDNKVIEYMMTGGSDKFEVMRNGSIRATQALDVGNYNVTVTAYNIRPYVSCSSCDNTTLTVSIHVSDVNNQPPRLNQTVYTTTIREGRVVNPVLRVFASDADTDSNFNSITYSVVEVAIRDSIYLSPTTGEVYIFSDVDYDPPSSVHLINFTVEASNTADASSTDFAQVTIYVNDLNDNTPTFDKSVYTCTVYENATSGTTFGCNTNATDVDSGNNAVLNYAIVQPLNAPFQVDPSTGQVSVSGSLDYESITTYLVSVRVTDQGVPPRSSTCQVVVDIVDVNDNPPVFTSTPYNFSIPETSPKASFVGTLSATDRDTNTNLTFTLISHTELFILQNRVDLKTLVVFNCSDSLDVQVSVSDGIHTVNTVVTVNVLSVNEYTPMFINKQGLAVLENATKGETIGTIQAEDADCGQNGHVSFSLIGGNTNQTFKIDNSSGEITLDGQLDYEAIKEYRLLVKAEDGGRPPRLSFTTVSVAVVDVDDSAPVFDRVEFTSTVYENSPNGTSILKLTARDVDTPNGNLQFGIMTPGQGIAVSPDGTLSVDGNLDTDGNTNVIVANVTVTDGARVAEAVARVTIMDVNDNIPVLTIGPRNISVPENAVVGQVIANVNATDADRSNSGFTYWLTRTDGKFAINASSGVLIVDETFDRSVQDYYNVGIHVSDHGIPPKFSADTLTVVIIDSNNAPVFNKTEFPFSVSENASIDTMVGRLVAYDVDRGSSGDIQYSFISGNNDGMFTVGPTTGEISLQKSLDYEHRNTYTLMVQATDSSYSPKSSTSTVIITVLDVPEAPQWPLPLPVVYMVKTNSCNKSRLTAFSRDITSITNSPSEVVYRLLNDTHVFSLANSTGALTVADPSLSVGSYVLGLEACNVDHPDLCTEAALTIVVTSDVTFFFCPAFLVKDVKEDAAVGYVVADLNTTVGDGDVTYNITEGNTEKKFSINTITGVVTVAERLDREKTDRYALLVVAGNGTQQAQTQVVVRVVDVQDSVPTFPLFEYDGEILESATPGDTVWRRGSTGPLVVTAQDEDENTVLRYRINATTDTSNGSFTVNATSGAVKLAREVDRETMRESLHDKYTFQIVASDESNNVSTTVVVEVKDVNDNSPQFEISELNITIPEDIGVREVITKVNATDEDSTDQGRLTFWLTSANTDPFAVNEYSGEVTVTRLLDRENVSSYVLELVVRDTGGRNSTMTLTVTLSDVNDNTPTFDNSSYVFKVEEGLGGVNATTSLSASDLDLGVNSHLTFSLIGGNSNNAFSIQTFGKQGVLTVDRALDREELGNTLTGSDRIIQLTLQVTDDGQERQLSSTCTVYVHVTDINDNSPTFVNNDYAGSVTENSINNTQVTLIPALSATDPDSGHNGTAGIRYELETAGVPFRIDDVNGTVFVYYRNDTDNIDREKTQEYQLKVAAVDDDGNGRRTVTNFTVAVTDVNDVTPVFGQTHYSFNVSEAAPLSFSVGEVVATDGDVGTWVTYTVVSGAESRFYIKDSLNGTIRVAGGLDREVASEYSLNVSASDGLHRGYTTVNITVNDANDNCPVFSNPNVHFDIMEGEAGNVTVGLLQASDADIGVNGEFRFFTNDTVAQGIFTVTEDGSLVTIATLDRETTPDYVFKAYAADEGSPPCVSSTTVNVRVLDANDNDPMFCHLNICNNSAIYANILEKSPVGTVVALPQVRDDDIGQNGKVTLSLTGNGSDLFNIDSETGLVRIKEQIEINRLFQRGILSGNFSNNGTFDLTIVAEDHGTNPRRSNVTLHLSIQEINDGAPTFSNNVYNYTIPEEENADYLVGDVEASAKNATGLTFTYSMIGSGQADEHFKINANTGSIKTTEALDRETRQRYSFAVQVRDGRVPERTAYAVVMVTLSDVNDNVPTFSLPVYRITVSEDATPQNLTEVSATDADTGVNGRVTYTLTTATDVFVLDHTSGQLRLNGSLDRETQATYVLTVMATDGGSQPLNSTSQVIVTVSDVNDNAPTFVNVPYIVYIAENSPPGQALVHVLATDPDQGLNGRVVYFLQPDAGTDVFQIDALDGKVTSVRSLDFEHKEVYDLTVMAEDLGTPSLNSTTTITVHVNDTYDTKPQFTPDFYSVTVSVATPVGTPLNVTLNAGNGNFYYTLTSGNDGNLFDIVPDTGVMRVAGDIVTQGNVLLTVMASDRRPSPSTDTANVLISITKPDVTFPKPEYRVSLPENLTPPVKLLDLNTSAELQGIPVTYTMTSQTDAFMVNSSTGELMCIKSLDREQTSEYKLQIQVSIVTPSSTRSKRAAESNVVEVIVTVQDRNDNPPRLQAPGGGTLVYGIPSSAAPNYLVVQLRAADPDEGENSVVLFTATSGDTTLFGVNPTSGAVRSLVKMVSVTATEFTLTVNATDDNGNGQSTSMKFKIIVIKEAERFGLVAHMQPSEFNRRKDAIIANLSRILGLEVQLEAVEPHTENSMLVLTKSDVYFHAVDPQTGKAVTFEKIKSLVTANEVAINQLLGVLKVLSVTLAPTITPRFNSTSQPYAISEAEIAIIVIAGVMFIGSVAAVVAIVKIWKQYEEWNVKQEKAKMARQRQKKMTEERAVDEGFNETNLDSDTADPIDPDASEDSASRDFSPGIHPRASRMAESLKSLQSRRRSVISMEEQEKVITLGEEPKSDNIIDLRNQLASLELDKVIDMFDSVDSSTDDIGPKDQSDDKVVYDVETGRSSALLNASQIPSTSGNKPGGVKRTTTSGGIASQEPNTESDIYLVPIMDDSRGRKDDDIVGADKNNIKSKNVRFTSAVNIDQPDSGNSSDSENMESLRKEEHYNPWLDTTRDTHTGELVTTL